MASNQTANKGDLAARRSLAWRIILPVPLTIILAIGLIWATVPRIVASMAMNDAGLANQQVATEFKTIRAYYSEYVVNKVVKGGVFTATHDHKSNENAIPVPATFVHDLSAALRDNDTTVQLYSPFPYPDRRDRKLDEFQQQAWDYLRANPDGTYSRTEARGGHTMVRVAVADKMAGQSCINCHNSDPNSPKRDWKLGDVRGVLEVASVIDAQLAHGATLSHLMVAGAGIIGLLLFGITLVVARGVTQPLTGMVRDMRKLAAGDFQVVLPGRGRAAAGPTKSVPWRKRSSCSRPRPSSRRVMRASRKRPANAAQQPRARPSSGRSPMVSRPRSAMW